jgi:hypothetical protein
MVLAITILTSIVLEIIIVMAISAGEEQENPYSKNNNKTTERKHPGNPGIFPSGRILGDALTPTIRRLRGRVLRKATWN